MTFPLTCLHTNGWNNYTHVCVEEHLAFHFAAAVCHLEIWGLACFFWTWTQFSAKRDLKTIVHRHIDNLPVFSYDFNVNTL